MAMLAERRQKVRWVLNPRQTAWSNDNNKFGQKYLEKLGWKAGQGIGANLQGCTEHVKVTVKGDNRGIGFKGVPEDVLPHQNDFSNLLAQLSNNSPSIETESVVEKSLEAKSRQSKARVHYHKFTRSKDLSVYSQKDLTCILGKPKRPNKDQVEEQDSITPEANFIQGGNMHAYFTKKTKHNSVDFVIENTTNVKMSDCDEDSNTYVGFGFNKTFDNTPASAQLDKEIELNEVVGKMEKKQKKPQSNVDNFQNGNDCVAFAFSKSLPINSAVVLESHVKKSRKKNKRCTELSETKSNYLDFGTSSTELEAHKYTEKETEKRKERKLKYHSVDFVRENVTNVSISDCDKDLTSHTGVRFNNTNEDIASSLQDKEGELNKSINKMEKNKKKHRESATKIHKVDILAVDFINPLSVIEAVESDSDVKKSRKSKKRSYTELVQTDTNLLRLATSSTELEDCEEIEGDAKKCLKKLRKKQKLNPNANMIDDVNQLLEVDHTEGQETKNETTIDSKKLQLLEVGQMSDKQIRKQRKQLSKSDQYVEVKSCEDDGELSLCAVSNELSADIDGLNDNLRRRKKKPKKGAVLEEGLCDSSLGKCTDNLSDNVDGTKKSKKLSKKQKCYDGIVALSEVSEHSLKKKKKKREAKEYEEIHNSDGCLSVIDSLDVKSDKPNENSASLKSRVKMVAVSEPDSCDLSPDINNSRHKRKIKHIQNSEHASNVVLVSLQENSATMDCENNGNTSDKPIDGDLVVSNTKKSLKSQQAKAFVEQQGCDVIDTVNALKNTEDLCTFTEHIKSNKQLIVFYEGVKYINGIADHNHHLPRRCWYSSDSMKTIPHCERNIFDGFPGSNIEKLGYG